MKHVIFVFSLVLIISCSAGKGKNSIMEDNKKKIEVESIDKSKAEWKKVLSEDQYYIMIEKGTERAFSGEYWDVFEDGVYKCAACGTELFKSDTKFDAHCGWPSFYESIDKDKIRTEDDYKLGYKRTEIMCAKCGAHLGHVFPDGPNPTGLRYCVNSVSIKLDTTSKK